MVGLRCVPALLDILLFSGQRNVLVGDSGIGLGSGRSG